MNRQSSYQIYTFMSHPESIQPPSANVLPSLTGHDAIIRFPDQCLSNQQLQHHFQFKFALKNNQFEYQFSEQCLWNKLPWCSMKLNMAHNLGKIGLCRWRNLFIIYYLFYGNDATELEFTEAKMDPGTES